MPSGGTQRPYRGSQGSVQGCSGAVTVRDVIEGRCSWYVEHGEVRKALSGMPWGSVQTVVTSPPYWGLRSYPLPDEVWGGDPRHEHAWTEGFCSCGAWLGQLGLEPTPQLYVEHLVDIFRLVRKVLRPDGTVWLNIGDSYMAAKGNPGPHADDHKNVARRGWVRPNDWLVPGLKRKDLVGIPWMAAFALRDDGWYLRSGIVWDKPNSMPESVRDRPAMAHEFIFLLAKSERYFYDAEAVKEPLSSASILRLQQADRKGETFDPDKHKAAEQGRGSPMEVMTRMAAKRRVDNAKGRERPPIVDQDPDRYARLTGRQLRSVWRIPPQPFKDAHFAVFPPALVEKPIKAGTSEAGQCPKCGTPWKRVIERVSLERHELPKDHPEYRPRRYDSKYDEMKGQGTGQRFSATVDRGAEQAARAMEEMGVPDPARARRQLPGGNAPVQEKEQLGWEPTCAHVDASPVPQVVLDPFVGSGTAGIVARRLGRRFVGIDLASDYAEMARRRIEDDQPLLNEPCGG